MKKLDLISKKVPATSLRISAIFLRVSFLCTLCLFSCKKDSDRGIVSVRVTDNNQNGFKGASVSIYSSVPAGQRIYFDSTDNRGICVVGKVLQGQYEYHISAKSDNKIYRLRGYFQVIDGEDKIINANPFSNAGNVKIRIMNAYMESESIANVNVALIPSLPYSSEGYSFQELIEKAYAIGKTDSEGRVEFQNMPADIDYNALVYFDSSTYDFPTYNNYMYITKDSNQSFTIMVRL